MVVIIENIEKEGFIQVADEDIQFPSMSGYN